MAIKVLPIVAVPNQAFTIVLDGVSWDLTIRATNLNVAVTLYKNSVLLLENIRAVAMQKIIPFSYLESGNFAFISNNYEVLDYTKFGVSQYLIYSPQADIDLARVKPKTCWTASDFDPNGALPLRFKPQGYTLA